MRAIFSVLGLLLVVAIVGLLAKKQLSTTIAVPDTTPGTTVQQQSQQIQQQVKQSVDAAMQQARPMPDDK
jgi:UPF0716 family protein affecting phage T7 exclusion